MAHVWYFLDEDCNRDEPAGDHCARCKKPIKPSSPRMFVVLHGKEMYVRAAEYPGEGERFAALVGMDCWRQIVASGEVKMDNK